MLSNYEKQFFPVATNCPCSSRAVAKVRVLVTFRLTNFMNIGYIKWFWYEQNSFVEGLKHILAETMQQIGEIKRRNKEQKAKLL